VESRSVGSHPSSPSPWDSAQGRRIRSGTFAAVVPSSDLERWAAHPAGISWLPAADPAYPPSHRASPGPMRGTVLPPARSPRTKKSGSVARGPPSPPKEQWKPGWRGSGLMVSPRTESCRARFDRLPLRVTGRTTPHTDQKRNLRCLSSPDSYDQRRSSKPLPYRVANSPYFFEFLSMAR
jgi:hypothetical protein